MIPALHVHPKDAYYRIQEPNSRLCLSITVRPAAAKQSPVVVTKLVPGSIATWFPRRDLAEQVVARYVTDRSLEIVRVDA